MYENQSTKSSATDPIILQY